MTIKQYMPPGFSKRLSDIILSSNMTITEIAKRAGVARSLIYHYAYDGVVPSSASLAKLCLVLHVSADYLLFGGKVCNT